MTEENRREIQTPYGKVRLTEEAAREANGPTPEEQKLARETYERQRRELEEREKAKINIDDLRRERGAKEIEEYRRTQRNLWITHGGTDAEFESSWPQIKSDYLQQKARDAYANVSSPFDR